MSAWWERPLRPGEFDVTVLFRVTAADADAARATVAYIVETDNFERHIVPMYVPPGAMYVPGQVPS